MVRERSPLGSMVSWSSQPGGRSTRCVPLHDDLPFLRQRMRYRPTVKRWLAPEDGETSILVCPSCTSMVPRPLVSR